MRVDIPREVDLWDDSQRHRWISEGVSVATIFETVASANRLNTSLARMNQAQFAGLNASLTTSLARAYQAQFAGLSAAMSRAYLPQSTAFSQAILKTYQPLLDAVIALGSLNDDLLRRGSTSGASDGRPQWPSDREIASMLATVVFLFVYISLGLAIKHNAQVAKLLATDGPTPFEAAMAVGALVFWLWMNHSRWFGGK